MGISIFKECNLLNGTFYSMKQKDLRDLRASQFKEGDIIKVSNYYIHIKYGVFDTPALCTYVENEKFKPLDCTPGSSKGFTPYYINDFKNK